MKRINRWMLGIAFAFTFAHAAQAGVSAFWNQDADGNWSDGSKWTGGIAAEGTTGLATFSHAITGNRTINVDTSPWAINALVFNNTGVFGWTITGGTLLLDGVTPTVTVSATGSAKIASMLSGSSGLTKAGDGTLILTGANTYSGGTSVSQGILQIGDGTSATASAGSGTLAVGINTLNLNLSGATTLPNSSVTASDLIKAFIQNIGTGKITLTNALINGTINGGAAGIVLVNTLMANNDNFRVQGDVTFGSSAFTAIESTAPNTTMHIVDNGKFWWIGAEKVEDAPTLDIAANVLVSLSAYQESRPLFYNDLTGAGNFTYDCGIVGQIGHIIGTSTLGGTLTANRPISFGNGGASGLAGNTRIASTVNGPVIFNSTTDNSYSGGMSGAGALIKANVNKLTLTGANTYSGATTINGGTLAVSGAGMLGAGAYAGDILNNGAFIYSGSAAQTLSGDISGTGSLTQTGSGTLRLGGFNTYTGETRVDAGKLVGLSGGGCLNSAVIVASGATNGVEVVAYGNQWTCAGLTFTGGSATLEFDLAMLLAHASPALLQINGDLDVNGNVNVVVCNGLWLSTGTYPLVSYTGALNGSGVFNLEGLPEGLEATLVNNVGAKQIDLVVTAILAPSGQESVWTHLVNDNASGDWGTAANWANGIPNGVDALANFSTLNIGSDAFIINDASHTVGTLRFADTAASHDWHLSDEPLTLATSRGMPTIDVINRQVIINAGLAGTQGFMKDGPGTLALEGLYDNTYSGPVLVREGVLYVHKGASLKNTSGSITVLPGACLDIFHAWSGADTLINPLYLNGSGVAARGAFNVWGNLVLAGPICLQSDSKITFENYIEVYGPITVVGGGKNLEVVQSGLYDSAYSFNIYSSINLGTGALTFRSAPNGGSANGYGLVLAAANHYSGGTVLTDHARLRVGHSAGLGSGGITLAPTTLLDLYTQSISIPWLSGTGGTITDAYGDVGTTTLTVNQSSDTLYSGVIKNGATRTLALVKTGIGSLSLSGESTYTGTTIVENGTLCAEGSLGTASVTVNTGSAFGAGTLGGAGHVNLAGTLTFLDNSRLLVDVQRAVADTISVTGDVAINSGVELRVSGDQSYGGKWKVVESTAGTLSGSFTLIGGVNGSRLTKEGNALWLIIPPKGTLVLIR